MTTTKTEEAKEILKCSFFQGHDWDKWIDKDISYSEHICIQQIRYCKTCNLVQGRSVVHVKRTS